jgi:outer membrane biosynthesis protein TonB
MPGGCTTYVNTNQKLENDMTYPQQPGFPQVPQQPQTPQAPQPQYAPPVYAPPQPQYAQPQQQYAPPMYAQPQQYSYPQQAPQGPAQQPAEASLDAFFSQPSVGWGPSITPTGKTPDGTAYMMVVAQHVTASHIEHATKFGSQTELDYYRNGKPKFVMKVPVFVAPGTQVQTAQSGVIRIDDGRAQYYVQGGTKDLLASAMAAVGAPEGPPELGALILATKTGSRPNRSGTLSAIVTIQYWRPGPEAAAFAQQSGIAYPDLNTPKPENAVPSAPAAPPAPPVQQPPAQPAPAEQAAQQVPAQPQAPTQLPQPPAPAAGGGLSPEQMELLSKLTGQPAG